MNEILKHKGRLAESELQAAELKLKLDSLRDSVRSELDEFEPVENLKAARAAGDAMELAEKQIQYKELLSQIAAIKKVLGR